MYKKSLELTCYVLGASAFGVFVRWMQRQLAFDDAGLVKGSFWNIFVLVIIAADIYMARRFVKEFKAERLTAFKDFPSAFAHPGKLHAAFRTFAGGLMTLGSLLLLATCETDINSIFYIILGVLGVLSGLSYIFLLKSAAADNLKPSLQRLMATMPVLMFAMWIITCYKANSINPVVWDFVIELAACSAAMISFFRIAGYVYNAPDSDRSMFWSIFGCFMCIMCLADERYTGQQIMLFAAALMQAFNAWILRSNMFPEEKKEEVSPDDGFVHLK